MLDNYEKQALPPSPTDNDPPQSIHPPPLCPASSRLKHFFPLVKSRSSSGLSSPVLPTIVTTSPTTPSDPFIRNDVVMTERLSSSSVENNMQSSGSSARTSSSITGNLTSPSQTHLHVITSSAIAAAIASNHIHFDDIISARTSDERTSASQMSQIRTSSSSNCPSNEATPSTTSSLSNTEKFFQKILPSQLIRRSHRQRHKMHSVSSLPDQQQPPISITRSAPASPKLSAQSGTSPSARSSNEDSRSQRLPLPPLPALQSSESLPATDRPILGSRTPSADVVSSHQQSSHRGRSSSVTSVSSDIAPRMTPSRSRRTNTIFTNLKGRDSGQRTPIEKLSLDDDEDEGYMLPPPDSDSGEEYFQKLQAEEGGLSRCMQKLVESDDSIHLSALSAYLQTIRFDGYPLDMAVRYLLMHLPLPKEQGAIYRLLEIFSRRYLACNPSFWDSYDPILVICYSILMLNTDAWNTNNKVKMTREQYIRNTSGQGASEDILSCWYDNVTLTPFIDSTHPTLSKLRLSKPAVVDRLTRPMLDTYNPLLESRLDELKIVYSTKGKEFTQAIENSLHYTGTMSTIPVEEIHSYVESAVRVTIIDRNRAKSEGLSTSRFGILTSLKSETARLVKVGVCIRRERLSRFGRVNGWQWVETGIVLLDSKLMFVKGELALIKSYLMSQKNDSRAVIPPLGGETIFELTGAIAFYDSGIIGPTDHSLRLVSQYGDSDMLCFPNDDVLNEWIGLINYLATIQSALLPTQDTDSSSISPALLRRRAGTMAPPAGRPVPLRAVSSTLELRDRSKSENAHLLPNTPHNKILIYSAFQKELEAKLRLEKSAVDALLRQARGLLIQTPLQDRTRLVVLSALERVTKRLKISRIEMERGICYIDVLSQIIAIIGERKIRIVEDDGSTTTEEFQLPGLGFDGHHKKSASDNTVDTMLSSTTLYTALNPDDDIGVPIRRIGTPTRNAKTTQPTLKEENKCSMAGKRSMSGVDLVGSTVGVQSSVVPAKQMREKRHDNPTGNI